MSRVLRCADVIVRLRTLHETQRDPDLRSFRYLHSSHSAALNDLLAAVAAASAEKRYSDMAVKTPPLPLSPLHRLCLFLICIFFLLALSSKQTFHDHKLLQTEGANSVCSLQASDWALVSPRVSPRYTRELTWPQFSTAKQSACSSGSQASAAAMRRLVQRISTAHSFSIVVIGGSSPAGVDCANELVERKDCSWPGRFVDALRTVFSSTKFIYTSHASGGWNHRAALASLPYWLSSPSDSDLLLVDFHINDAVVGGGAPADFLEEAESLILAVRRLRPTLEILYVSSMCDTSGNVMNTIYKAITTAHAVPLVSYFDLVSAVSFIRTPGGGDAHPSSALGLSPWCEQISHHHPTWPIHQLIADTALGCVEAAWADLCGLPLNSTILTLPSRVKSVSCEIPVIFLSAQLEWERHASPDSKYETAVAIRSSSWDLVEDRLNKPGWVSSSASSWIEFDVRFGARPRLAIAYLQSYEGLGAAVGRFLSQPSRTFTLDGLYSLLDPQLAQRVSQTTYLTMEVESKYFHADLVTDKEPHGLIGALGFSFPPFHSDTLRFEVAPNRNPGDYKFKIISLTAC